MTTENATTEDHIDGLAEALKRSTKIDLSSDQILGVLHLLRKHWSNKTNIGITIDVAIIKG